MAHLLFLKWLVMSFKSHIEVEVAHSITVLHHIFWLRSGSGGESGLQLAACGDLMEDLHEDRHSHERPTRMRLSSRKMR